MNVTNVTNFSETTISTFAGSDTINIQTINAETTVNAGIGNDTINVGTNAPATGGNVNAISAALNVHGDGGSDTLNFDDTGDSNTDTGTLTSTELTGLDMAVGTTYGTTPKMNLGISLAGFILTFGCTGF